MAFTFPLSFFVVRHVINVWVFQSCEAKCLGFNYQTTQEMSLARHLALTLPLLGSCVLICCFVKNLGVNTAGAVVRSGEALMEILPVDDRLVVEAKISPSEIAFVRTGMDAVVKIDAYDYTIFGDLSGTLTYLSADTLVDNSDSGAVPYYRAQVTTTGDRFSKQDYPGLEILPGMTATVEIKTGKSTVFSYLTKPLVKTVSESFTDR